MKNQDLENVVSDALKVIQNDVKFDRFNGYADEILENIEKKLYKPLKVKSGYGLISYINIDNARKKNPEISLRFLGQEVARLDKKLIVKPKNHSPFKTSFNWNSPEGTNFRKFYNSIKNPKLRSPEHKDEFLILTEMEKKSSITKSLLNIQPVKIDHKFRFQFPSALNSKGYASMGNIDLLCRVGRGLSNLAVIELKTSESYLKKNNGIDQAIRYAVFIRELLRSQESLNRDKWMSILGFKIERIGKPITFYATLMVPLTLKNLALVHLSKYGSAPDYASYIFSNGDKIQISSLYYDQMNDGIQIKEIVGINEVKLNNN